MNAQFALHVAFFSDVVNQITFKRKDQSAAVEIPVFPYAWEKRRRVVDVRRALGRSCQTLEASDSDRWTPMETGARTPDRHRRQFPGRRWLLDHSSPSEPHLSQTGCFVEHCGWHLGLPRQAFRLSRQQPRCKRQ